MARPTKRRTKHRGNAAGMIEARGVTGSRSSAGKSGGSRRPNDPRLREPNWRSAFTRALFAAAVFAVVMIALMKAAPAGVALTSVILLGIYTPFGYYFDQFLYRRRLAKLGITPAAKVDAPKAKANGKVGGTKGKVNGKVDAAAKPKSKAKR